MSKILCEFILGIDSEMINEKVVIAPCWLPDSVGISNFRMISEKTCKIWECIIGDSYFTYIVTGVGAAICMDIVMALGETKCNKIMFIGSAGSLKKEHRIGDFAVHTGIISAEGASRFIGDEISKDVFGNVFHSSEKMQKYIYKSCNEIAGTYRIHVYDGLGVSVESILLQYRHINKFYEMNCDFIDMESSAFLAATNNLQIESVVVFCISDNVANDEPLYKISSEKTQFRKSIRKEIMPILLSMFLKY